MTLQAAHCYDHWQTTVRSVLLQLFQRSHWSTVRALFVQFGTANALASVLDQLVKHTNECVSS